MDDSSRIATIREGSDFGDTTPALKYNLDDHLGSSNILVDENGTLVNQEEYYPFGETSFGAYAKKRYRFCGKEKDEESGMYYYGARYYSPWLCRFVSVDPLAGDYPFYTPFQYAGNQPINFIDLDGLEQAQPQTPAGSAGSSPIPAVGGNTPVQDNTTVVAQSPNLTNLTLGTANNKPAATPLSSQTLKIKPVSLNINTTSTIPNTRHQINQNIQSNQAKNQNSQGTIKPFEPTLMDSWSESNGFLGKTSYGIFNGIYITAQSFNPFDTDISQLNGNVATAKDRTDAFVNTVATFTPIKGRSLTTTSEGFMLGSYTHTLKSPLNVSFRASSIAMETRTFQYSTIAPKSFMNSTTFARSFLQLTPKMQPALGSVQNAIIPAGTKIQIGLTGFQSGQGIGTWLQIYTPNRLPF